MSGEARRRRLRALVRLAGVKVVGDLDTVERAFTHESFVKEHGGESNERLEFLGDSVLGFITASWLFERFPGDDEGALTVRKARIVNDPQLAQTGRRLDFAAVLAIGAGMRNAGGTDNTSILADAFEAFVAALFLRYGIEPARRFVEGEHIAQLDHAAESLLDAKSRLQHWAQEHLGATPVYKDESRGTPQKPSFSSVVSAGKKKLGSGEGLSKKAAQQAAATAALQNLETRKVRETQKH